MYRSDLCQHRQVCEKVKERLYMYITGRQRIIVVSISKYVKSTYPAHETFRMQTWRQDSSDYMTVLRHITPRKHTRLHDLSFTHTRPRENITRAHTHQTTWPYYPNGQERWPEQSWASKWKLSAGTGDTRLYLSSTQLWINYTRICHNGNDIQSTDQFTPTAGARLTLLRVCVYAMGMCACVDCKLLTFSHLFFGCYRII